MSHYGSWKHIIQVKSEPNDVQEKYLDLISSPFFLCDVFFLREVSLLLAFSWLQGSVYYILESVSVLG